MLDTSVVSAIMRREPEALRRLKKLLPGDLLICSPVAAEIRFGLDRLPEGSRKRVLLEAEYSRLRALVSWCNWTEAAAHEFGRQKVLLERLGTPVADMDVIIGSVALSQGAAVATANARDFRRMTSLRVEDWGTHKRIRPAGKGPSGDP